MAHTDTDGGGSHAYLAGPRTSLGSHTTLEIGSRHTFTLIELPLVLFPGQTLPLRIRRGTPRFTVIKAMLADAGVPPLLAFNDMCRLTTPRHGVTLEITSHTQTVEEGLSLVCVARQRIARTDVRGVWVVLPDDEAPPVAGVDGADLFVRRQALALFDAQRLAGKLLASATALRLRLPTAVSPLAIGCGGPTELSFELARGGPFNVEEQALLLSEGCTFRRIKHELALLRDYSASTFSCTRCNGIVCASSSLVAMSAAGACDVFVNPASRVFRIATATSVNGCSVGSHPVTEDSWYEGWGWSMLQCRRCGCHSGWRFDWMPAEKLHGRVVRWHVGSNQMRVMSEEEAAAAGGQLDFDDDDGTDEEEEDLTPDQRRAIMSRLVVSVTAFQRNTNMVEQVFAPRVAAAAAAAPPATSDDDEGDDQPIVPTAAATAPPPFVPLPPAVEVNLERMLAVSGLLSTMTPAGTHNIRLYAANMVRDNAARRAEARAEAAARRPAPPGEPLEAVVGPPPSSGRHPNTFFGLLMGEVACVRACDRADRGVESRWTPQSMWWCGEEGEVAGKD